METKIIATLLAKLTEEEGRKHLFFIFMIPLVAVLVVLTVFVYLLASPAEAFGSYAAGNGEESLMEAFQSENGYLVTEYVDLSFYGNYPLPFDHDGTVSITDDYGYRIHPISGEYKMHWGIDFATVHHCEIKSIADGVVAFSGVYGTYGNTVIIKHEDISGVFYSQYSHLSEIEVMVGETISQLEVVGYEGGDSGDPHPGASTGHHLHFSVMNENREYVDPKEWLQMC